MAQSESVSGSQSLSGSTSASSRCRHQYREARLCKIFDCDADADRYSLVLKSPCLFGKDIQVSSTGSHVSPHPGIVLNPSNNGLRPRFSEHVAFVKNGGIVCKNSSMKY